MKVTAEQTTAEVFPWLKTLPLAPEYHPTIQEFQDPISYIFKIEKEASKFGICKIVPPLPPQSKKSVLSNLNKSLSLLSTTSPRYSQNPKEEEEEQQQQQQPTFTTRQQQVGFCPRKQRPIHKNVWQSGEYYTLQQFEAKAKNFEKNYLKNRVGKKTISPLEVETLYWKANGDRPFSVEYANDMPGSAFVPMRDKKTGEIVSGCAVNVGDTAWNMRGVARANGSLLRFMKEEIPGVTSPMVYLAMLFSWFAWHVEDHDLHSLNYLHMGAGKTWYGVPNDAAAAFEEVIRVHGFGEEINPLVTFATLGEKTTVMSPEVLVKAGVPCCRLVQNAGEFVVTFPRAYHSGFSHGFNCGEASNIATPEWLKFAKDAAIRRASINYPPMVSHFQLLYDLALAICSRTTTGNNAEPRSSRLKDKKKGEGEMLVKQMFVQDVMQNNDLLYALGQGSEVVLLPHNASEKFVWSNLRVGSKYKVKPGLPFSLYSSEEAIKASDDIMLARDVGQPKAFSSVKTKFGGTLSTSPHEVQDSETERGGAAGDGLSDRGLFSCVKCGIWTFACVAIVQPTESAAQYLMSADCSFLNDWTAGSGVSTHGIDATDGEANVSDPESFSGSMVKNAPDSLYDIIPVRPVEYQAQSIDNTFKMASNAAETIKFSSRTEVTKDSSALGLLAMTYGNSSDSDEDDVQPNCHVLSEDNLSGDGSWGARYHQDDSASPHFEQGYDSAAERGPSQVSSRSECEDGDSPQRLDIYGHCGHRTANSDEENEYETHNCSAKFTEEETFTSLQNYSPVADEHDTSKISCATDPVGKPNLPFGHRCDEDSSRMHVFCLEHAVEVEKQLRPIGGVHILLLCHPDYPNVEVEAKKVAEELEMDYVWKDVGFSVATTEDEEQIQMALHSEEATPRNGDWAVKLGINLFYSAILSRSPLYSKQMPYNSVIYSAFGCISPSKSSPEAKFRGKGFGRQKKLVMAGKWCGRVWMSNQVHPLLLQRDSDEEERILNACLKSNERAERKYEASQKAQTTSAKRKLGKKRKPKAESKIVKKMKFEASEFAGTDPEDSGDDKPELETRRSVRKSKAQRRPSKRVKNQEEMPDTFSEESQDDILSYLRRPLKSARALKQGATHILKGARGDQNDATFDSYSDGDSQDDRSPLHGLRSTNKNLKVERISTRNVNTQPEEIVNSESEGSLSDDSELEEHRRNIGSPSSSQRQVVFHKQFDPVTEDDEMDGGPSTRLRKRISRPTLVKRESKPAGKRQVQNAKGKKAAPVTKNVAPARKGPKMRLPVSRGPAMKGPARKIQSLSSGNAKVEEEEEEEEEAEFSCDMEGCTMSFASKQELALHKRNICPVKGCGKKFFSHKYLVQHRRVHMDDRPLKCPWKGCRMTFKWAWARTEHIRVHTGARPYVCNEVGCGQTFRFVSDFSRHKRKTGHSAKKTRK